MEKKEIIKPGMAVQKPSDGNAINYMEPFDYEYWLDNNTDFEISSVGAKEVAIIGKQTMVQYVHTYDQITLLPDPVPPLNEGQAMIGSQTLDDVRKAILSKHDLDFWIHSGGIHGAMEEYAKCRISAKDKEIEKLEEEIAILKSFTNGSQRLGIRLLNDAQQTITNQAQLLSEIHNVLKRSIDYSITAKLVRVPQIYELIKKIERLTKPDSLTQTNKDNG